MRFFLQILTISLLFPTLANAVGQACEFEFKLGDSVAFVCNDSGDELSGNVCLSSDDACTLTVFPPGITAIDRPLGQSSFVTITLPLEGEDMYFLAEGVPREEFDWSRVVYLVLGSSIALAAGYGTRLISFSFEQKSTQRQLVRQWRDELIREVRAADDKATPELTFSPPAGMSSANVKRAMSLHDKLSGLFNKVRIGQLDMADAQKQALDAILAERAG